MKKRVVPANRVQTTRLKTLLFYSEDEETAMSATRSILKKNPYYKDYEKDPKYVRKFDKWKQELQKTSHTLVEVNVLHQATQRLEEQMR